MDKEQLTALRDVLDLILRLPDAMRSEIAAWLRPEAAQKPSNGVDRHPLPVAPNPSMRLRSASIQRLADASAAKARVAEENLLIAMRQNPGLTERALANAAKASRSATSERLKRLAAAGTVEKDRAGRWKLTGTEAPPAGEEPRPFQPSPS
jgi:hypothetical protein